MLIKRELVNVKTRESELGFLGPGHIAHPLMMIRFTARLD